MLAGEERRRRVTERKRKRDRTKGRAKTVHSVRGVVPCGAESVAAVSSLSFCATVEEEEAEEVEEEEEAEEEAAKGVADPSVNISEGAHSRYRGALLNLL